MKRDIQTFFKYLGIFSIQHANTKFSLMVLDQNYQHCIKFLKEEGGTNNTDEKEMINVGHTEVLRAFGEFELAKLDNDSTDDDKIVEHPESSMTYQQQFLRDLDTLISLVKDNQTINTFMEIGSDLVTPDTDKLWTFRYETV